MRQKIKQKLKLGRLFILLLMTVSIVSSAITPTAKALTPEDFQPGYIISDTVFTNYQSMSVSGIQSFINSKVPVCDTNGQQLSEFGGPDLNGDGKVQRWEWGQAYYDQTVFTCLKDYSEGGRSAAQIIYDAAVTYEVNPQVLLVLLQKEQALITDTWPLDRQYRSATGYGCPDTAACDEEYYGFTNQVENAAYMYHAIMTDSPTWYTPYNLGNNYILYNPSTSCGGSVVDIKNRATQALYNYTPYQPNNATLEYKLGDGSYPSCGAFGNINFFIYFSNWFGSTFDTNILYTVYDSNSDKTGDAAVVGLSLSRKPTSNVIIPISIDSPENAAILNGQTTITITPSTWNNPSLNKIVIIGVNNTDISGNIQYYLKLGRPASSDIRFSSISDSMTDDIPLLQQDSSNGNQVYQLSKEGYHTYATNSDDITSLVDQGWTQENIAFNYCYSGNKTISRLSNGNDYRLSDYKSSEYQNLLSSEYSTNSLLFTASYDGSIPVYWLYNSITGDSIYSIDETPEEGYESQGIVFNSCPADSKPIYRLYRPSTNHYFLTESPYERDRAYKYLGYAYEGTAFYTCEAGSVNIYRLYNSARRQHFYTASSAERDKVLANNGGWIDNGVAFKMCEDASTPVMRLFNAGLKKHVYTPSESEKNKLINNGYVYEGTVFNAD